MEAKPYNEFTDEELLALCVWREARGEGYMGKRGVAHVIRNRVEKPGWWGHSVEQVILKPYQFSSFNHNDPNNLLWPPDEDPAWKDCLQIATNILTEQPEEQNDITNGAVYYFSPPLSEPPSAWGAVEVTLKVGRLTFCKPSMGGEETT